MKIALSESHEIKLAKPIIFRGGVFECALVSKNFEKFKQPLLLKCVIAHALEWGSQLTRRDCAVLLSAEEYLSRALDELEERFEPVHTIDVQGGTLVEIYRLGEDDASRAALANAHTTLAGASKTLASAKTRSRGQRR